MTAADGTLEVSIYRDFDSEERRPDDDAAAAGKNPARKTTLRGAQAAANQNPGGPHAANGGGGNSGNGNASGSQVVLDANGVPLPQQSGAASATPGAAAAAAAQSAIAAEDAFLQKIQVAQNTIFIGRDNTGKNTLIHNILGPTVRKTAELEENLSQYSNSDGSSIWKYELSSSENGGWSMNALKPILDKGGVFQIVVVVQANSTGVVDVAPISAVLYGMKVMGHKLSYGIIVNGYACSNFRSEFPELNTAAAREWHYVPSVFALPVTEGLKTLSLAKAAKVPGLWNFFESFRITIAPQQVIDGSSEHDGQIIPQQNLTNQVHDPNDPNAGLRPVARPKDMFARFFTWQLHKGHIAEPPKYDKPEDIDDDIELREMGAAKEPLLNGEKLKEYVSVVMNNEIKTDIMQDEEGYGQNVLKNKHRGQGFDIKGQNGKKKITIWQAKRETRNVESKRIQNKDATTITQSKVYRATITIDVLRRPEEAVTKEFRARVKKMINASGNDYSNQISKIKEDYGEYVFTRIVVGGLFSDERKMVTQEEKTSELDRKDMSASAMTQAQGAGEKDVNTNTENNLRLIEQSNVVVGGIPSHSQGRYLWSRSVYREDVDSWEVIDILESIPIEKVIDRIKEIEEEAQRLEMAKPKWCRQCNAEIYGGMDLCGDCICSLCGEHSIAICCCGNEMPPNAASLMCPACTWNAAPTCLSCGAELESTEYSTCHNCACPLCRKGHTAEECCCGRSLEFNSASFYCEICTWEMAPYCKGIGCTVQFDDASRELCNNCLCLLCGKDCNMCGCGPRICGSCDASLGKAPLDVLFCEDCLCPLCEGHGLGKCCCGAAIPRSQLTCENCA